MEIITRPNGTNIWNDKEILTRFQRYYAIIDKRKIARYLLAKKVPIEFDKETPIEKLWDIHIYAVRKFKKFLQEMDAQENSLNYFIALDTPQTSFLDLKIELANRILRDCHFCERACGINREKKKGICRLGVDSYVSSWFHHMGEEIPLIPSGTIFFESCCFKCVFCQNFDLSQKPSWILPVNAQKLAIIANGLAREGVKNINYVTPLPNTHIIIESFKSQIENITQLWNSNHYCSMDIMKLILEVIDFWLPDFKYGDNTCAEKYSKIPHYFEVVARNHKLVYDEGNGEMIIRHLIMPNHIECCTKPMLDWIAKNCPKAVVNIMGQYHPTYQAHKYPEINRRPTEKEIIEACHYATELEITYMRN